MVCGTLDVRCRCVVVEYERCPLAVPYLLTAHFIKRINSLQIQIVDLRKINLSCNDFPCAYLFAPAVFCKNPSIACILTPPDYSFSHFLFYRKQLNIVYDLFDTVFLKWYHQSTRKKEFSENFRMERIIRHMVSNGRRSCDQAAASF